MAAEGLEKVGHLAVNWNGGKLFFRGLPCVILVFVAFLDL